MADDEEPIFKGRIKHFSYKPGGLLVDCFETYDEEWFDTALKRYYFISHAHTDHFAGLWEVQDELPDNPQVQIYCTKKTFQLITKTPGICRENIEPNCIFIEPGELITLDYHTENCTEVEVIAANHIPGSVMFLFDDGVKRALYTGDFRFDESDSNQEMDEMCKFFGDYKGRIDYLYLDVTFLDLARSRAPEQNVLPSRSEIKEELVDFVNERKRKKRLDGVHVECNRLGCQEIAEALAREFNCPIGVSEDDDKLNLHKCIISRNMTYCPMNYTFVHISGDKLRPGQNCPGCTANTLRIKPSVLWTIEDEDGRLAERSYSYDDESTWIQENKNSHYWWALLSHHSSDEEIREFVKLINYQTIYPINVPAGISMPAEEFQQLRQWVNDELQKSKKKRYYRR